MSRGTDRRALAGRVPDAIEDEITNLVDALYFRCTTPAGLATDGGDASTVANSALSYLHDGQFQSLSAGSTAFTADTHDIGASADTTGAAYVLSVDGSQSITITKGPEATGARPVGAPEPDGPAEEAQLGVVRITVDSGSTFDATTDDLSASHLSTSFEDFGAPGGDLAPSRVNV